MKRSLVTLLAVLVLGGEACAMVDSGGFHVYKDTYEEGFHSVASQAAFATGCAQDQVQVVVLAVTPDDKGLPASMGATACGKKLIYQRVPGAGTWMLNSDSSK